MSDYAFTGAYRAGAAGAQTLSFKITVATAAAARLGTLVTTLPFNANLGYPKHVMIQVPALAAHSIYVTCDNVTTPVAGGPGIEMAPGSTYIFDNELALVQDANVSNLTAFQLIAATADVDCLVNFFY
jgi:hypothetical protein